MRLILSYARAYPVRTILALVALFFAGLAEGVGISSMLPLLSVAVDGKTGAGHASGLENLVVSGLAWLNLSPTIGVLLLVVLLGVVVKSVLVLVANRQVGYTVANVATDLRLELIRALLAARWEYYVHQPVGALANSAASEANRASEGYLNAATIMAQFFQVVVYFIVAVLVAWKATLVSMGFGFLCLLVLTGLVRMSRRAGGQQTRLLHSLLARLTDSQIGRA